MRPLLVVDGDSFAHRAYHAIPKTLRRADGGPGNMLFGFGTMLLRLWQAEHPRTRAGRLGHLRSADVSPRSARRVPERAVSSTRSSSSSSGSSPLSWRRPGSRMRKRPATRRTTSSARRPRRGGSRRDGARRDLGSRRVSARERRTTILQPVRGEAAHASGRPRCASATASIPAQVPDFIALRGDPSDRIPGARGIGPKKAADLLAQYADPGGDAGGGAVRGRSRRASPLSGDRDPRPLGAAPTACRT